MASNSCSMLPPPFQPLVDHQGFLVAELGQVLLEPGQAGLVHRLDVEVADPAVRQLVDLGPPLVDPALVAEVGEGRLGIGSYLSFHEPASSGLAFNVSSTLRLSRRPRKAVTVVAGLDRLAVDGDQVVRPSRP